MAWRLGPECWLSELLAETARNRLRDGSQENCHPSGAPLQLWAEIHEG